MSAPGFLHEALVYRDDEGFLDGTVPFLREGARAGETVFALLPPARIELVRAALDEDADQVLFLDMTEVGRNPARVIPALRELVDGTDGRPARGLGEPVWTTIDADQLAEVGLHEALVNQAFEGAAGLRLRCPYDVAAVEDEVVGAAERSHSVLVDAGVSKPSERYDPDQAHGEFAATLPAPAEVSDMAHFTLDDLPELRDLVTVRASGFGLSRDRALDLTLATNEIVTNSICHGGERGTLRLWSAGDAFVCEVSDGGHIAEPMVGRVMPRASVRGGRGVWLANQLCDLVQIRSAPATGTVVRLHMRRQV
ncbi:anti-sigma factor RsbA family regulatory protein [Actinokineospora sp.]|uniref:anti-sigma factor RsbA family regulatory protein n=1 Tax=Actinokineospora sp. TaxID=1872133 RepID=UPI00403845B3